MSKDRWRDHYTDEAKRKGYLARSVFKLKEADERFRLVRAGARVLDLGCAPGSWLQYLSRKVGRDGLVVGIDINEPAFSAHNVRIIVADIFELDASELAEFGRFDLVVSDAAPATTGVPDADAAKSLRLAVRAFEIATSVLKGGGNLLVKVFESPDVKTLRDKMRERFSSVRSFKPRASRSASREHYLVGLGFKGE